VWETTDPDGRLVVLEWEGWRHIRGHRELDVSPEAILRVVAAPDERLAGRAPYEEWFYASGIGPSAWVKVVVHYEAARGLVITAFPRRSFP
jgi:hypothetical protein